MRRSPRRRGSSIRGATLPPSAAQSAKWPRAAADADADADVGREHAWQPVKWPRASAAMPAPGASGRRAGVRQCRPLARGGRRAAMPGPWRMGSRAAMPAPGAWGRRAGRMNAALHPCVDDALPRVGGQDAGLPRCETPDACATRHARCSTPGHAQGTHSVDRRQLPCDRQRCDRRVQQRVTATLLLVISGMVAAATGIAASILPRDTEHVP